MKTSWTMGAALGASLALLGCVATERPACWPVPGGCSAADGATLDGRTLRVMDSGPSGGTSGDGTGLDDEMSLEIDEGFVRRFSKSDPDRSGWSNPIVISQGKLRALRSFGFFIAADRLTEPPIGEFRSEGGGWWLCMYATAVRLRVVVCEGCICFVDADGRCYCGRRAEAIGLSPSASRGS